MGDIRCLKGICSLDAGRGDWNEGLCVGVKCVIKTLIPLRCIKATIVLMQGVWYQELLVLNRFSLSDSATNIVRWSHC